MLRFSTAGESHGESLVAMVSGMPAGVPVDQEFIDRELWRRQQGLWTRRPDADRAGYGAYSERGAAWEDDRVADCDDAGE